MPMELRKRKAPPPPPPATGKKPAKIAKTVSKAAEKVKETVAEVAATANGSSTPKPAIGDIISLDSFGGEIETNDGTKTTLKALVDASKAGVVLFTYPKASTPGCTRQACHFRDAYEALTSASGLAIYGLSTDSPKANTTFREKQHLPYPLLCDPQATLIGAIGLKKTPGKGTVRGVFVVDKAGKVLAAQAGSPEGTVEVVRGLVEGGLGAGGAGGEKKEGEAVKGEEKGEAKEEGFKAKKNGDAPPPAVAGDVDGANGEEKRE
ncbi:AhpC-TSA-domain-containing protein [Parathielavia appendiculata]|uniref:thioredoxin-dependent peroxiredoxin n=1 Tax=Parathielavia appendiculata TaxID=2587402 RepID=A0AAN6TVL3_9PEZI|nr:AhpC-TSA-domain-containing protein [Parathielavia appendiculata]